jgi:preprotein translocase subunit SecG
VHTAYNVLLFIAILIAIVFSALVLITGKGDAMSGGGSVRTSFKGKASFDDAMARVTLILGASFFFLMLLIDGVSNRIDVAAEKGTPPPTPASAPAKK